MVRAKVSNGSMKQIVHGRGSVLNIVIVILFLLVVMINNVHATKLVIFPSFYTSFQVRDRTLNNKIVMNGAMNVKDSYWEEVDVLLNYTSSNLTIYYHNGQVVHEDYEEANLFGKDMTQEQQKHKICVNELENGANVPSLHLIRAAVDQSQKFIISETNHTLVFDREVNICIRKGFEIYTSNFMGQTYVVCMNGKLPVKIIGRELLVTISHLAPEKLSDTLTQKTQEIVKSVCPAHARLQAMPFVNNAIEQPWFLSHADSCRYNWIRDPVICQDFEKHSLKSDVKKKTCIFLHGVGNEEEIAGPPTHEYTDYWGNVHEYTPQCSERWFIREETKLRGWDDKELQIAYCNLALINQTEEDNVIRDKVLFVHSMGNLILAGAILNGFCDLDLETSSWYEIGGPFFGSKAAKELETICLYMYNGEWVSHFSPRFVKWVATTGGYCVPGTNRSYHAYDTLDPGYPGIQQLIDVAYLRIKGAMCGESSFGLNSIYSAALLTLSMYVGFGDLNDGLVPWHSCQNGSSEFVQDYHSPFFLGMINHADETCRNGNGLWSLNRQPCSWYTDKL